MKTGFIPADYLINEYLDASGHEGELDPVYILKCVNDAVDRISTSQQLEHKVAMLDVRDYKAKLPDHFKYVIQAAARVDAQPCTLKEQISKMKQRIPGSECNLEISIECPRCHKESCECDDLNVVTVDADRIWKSANPQYMASYMRSFYSYGNATERGKTSVYSDQFLLMKHAGGSMWNAPYHIGNCLNLSVECGLEYSINMPVMVTNFRRGQVLLGYMSSMTDDRGYLMVPDTPQAIQAVTWYVNERMAFRKYSQSQSAKDERFWQNMYQLREKHIARAKSELRIPSQDEYWTIVENFMKKVIPYRSFNRNLSRNMPDTYHLPNRTMNIDGYDG